MADQDINIEGIQNALDELQEKFGINDKALASFTKAVKKTSADFNKSVSDLNKEIAKNKAGYKEQLALINKLDDAIEDLTESAKKEQNATKKLATEQEKAALIAQRDALQTSASMRGLQEATAKATTEMGKTAVKGAGEFVKGLQSNASGIDLAAGLMNAGIDFATSGVKGLAQGVTAAAPMLMRMGPWGMAAGAALTFLGIAAETGADSLNKLAKFGVAVLQKEAEKTFKAFNSMNASGAMFTDGMTGMRNAASGAGLTVDAFSKVVQDNQLAIAASGLGMTEGVKQIGKISSDLKKSGVQQQLMNLGFSLEEQAGLIAETMRDMRAAGGGPLKASNAEVAEQTQKYAENLRIIAAITGEDAKKKMEETRDQANQLMFQQKLAGMDETQRQNVINAMANMSKQQQKDYMDMVNFGSIVNKTGAIMASTMPSYAASIQASADATKRGVLNDNLQRDINSRNQAGMMKEAMEAGGVAAANAAGISGAASDAASAIMDQVLFMRSQTKEAIAAAEADAKKAKDPADGLTKGLIGAEQAAYGLKAALEKELLPAVTKFATAADQILKGTRKMLDEYGLGDPTRKAAEDAKNAATIEKGRADQNFLQKLITSDKTTLKRQERNEWLLERGYEKEQSGMTRDKNGKLIPVNDILPDELKHSGIELFAEGGTIPAGKTGIVGEAGPEFVTGPAEVTSAKESKKILDELGLSKNISMGQLTSQALKSFQAFTSEDEGSLAGFFLNLANKLEWMGDNDTGSWTLGGEVIDQEQAREILDFARNWPKLKQEMQYEIDKAREMIGEDGSLLDASLLETGSSTRVSDYVTGFAKGGIASGSLSGYQATLHGTEAVVPLPDNKSIPVSLDSSALNGAIQAQSDILNNILSAMQQNNKYASGLLQNSY